MSRVGRALVLVLLLGSATAWAEADGPALGTVVVELKDGGRLVGRVLEEDPSRIRIRTSGGLELDVLREMIESIRPAGERRRQPQLQDPNYSRLMLAPTGRPLKKGDGYFSDYELVFPGVAVGITDHLSLAGGVSTMPGLGLQNQVFYVSPRLGHSFSDRAAASIGALYAMAGGGDGDGASLGILFGVGTFGSRERSLTVGLGLGDVDLGDDGFQATPIVMLGGTARVSRNLALITESWLVLHDDFRLSLQPFGIGVRFFGERLSADVGFILVGELLRYGFPFPWASISYHFGPSRSNGGQARAPARPVRVAVRPPASP